jgi:hypothetical protein
METQAALSKANGLRVMSPPASSDVLALIVLAIVLLPDL